jgi:type II secretory pathway pseudopilin PulG
MRSVSTLQLALLVALLGSLAAAFVPTFLSNIHASRFAEPLDGLSHLASQATMYAAGLPSTQAYPESVERTPALVPPGQSTVDAPGTWTHPTWRLLNFSQEGPHYYSFEFESHASETGAHYVARAFGDLDGDGELSHFEVYGETKPGGEPKTFSLRIDREVE